MDTPPKLAQLLDLPNELLSLIVEDLDSDSLFQLSGTCKALHYVALPAFFERNDVKEPANGWVVVYKAPRQTLPALRMALFVERLDQIHFYLNPEVDRLLAEVRDLRRLVARLPSIDQMKLHFSVFDSWLVRLSTPILKGKKPSIDVDVWREEFGSMLDQLLVKGCKKLHITGGSQISTIYTPKSKKTGVTFFHDVEQLRSKLDARLLLKPSGKKPTSPTGTFFGVLRRKFTSLFCHTDRKAALKTTTPEAKPQPPLPGRVSQPESSCPSLQEFYIHCEMLLQAPFLEWTLSALQINAESITTLSFKCMDIPSTSWSDFFALLTFPSLEEFEITSDLIVRPQGPEFPCVESFLTRHPSITILYLYGLTIPPTFPPPQEAILPNLEKLTAHPKYVSWLLSGPNPLPCLGSVTISSEYHVTPEFDYNQFDEALVCIARTGREVALGIRFSSEGGVDNWLESHVEAGREASHECETSLVNEGLEGSHVKPGRGTNYVNEGHETNHVKDEHQGSPLALLTTITHLTIRSFWFVEFTPRTLEVLPSFLALFPALEHVKFTEQPEENEKAMLAGGGAFVKAIGVRCPRVKRVLINRLPVDSGGMVVLDTTSVGDVDV